MFFLQTATNFQATHTNEVSILSGQCPDKLKPIQIKNFRQALPIIVQHIKLKIKEVEGVGKT